MAGRTARTGRPISCPSREGLAAASLSGSGAGTAVLSRILAFSISLLSLPRRRTCVAGEAMSETALAAAL